MPTTFRSANIAANTVNIVESANATLRTRIPLRKRKRSTPQVADNNAISIATPPPPPLISRNKHPLTPALFEADIVDAPTRAQRERQQQQQECTAQQQPDRQRAQQKERAEEEDNEKSRTIVMIETRSPTPIDNIVFYVEKHATPDWRKMHLTARRLRSLTAHVFPVLHHITIGVCWSGLMNQEASESQRRAVFQRRRALRLLRHSPVSGRMSRAVQQCYNQDVCACIEAHYGAFRDDKVDASDNDDEADGDDDIKIDIEFVKRYLKSLHFAIENQQ
jgi:hypothetical protein